MSSSQPFLYPNVSSIGGTSQVRQDRAPKESGGVPGEFDRVLEERLEQSADKDLSKIREPLKFSSHASKRMMERKIAMDPATMGRVRDAVDMAAAKGVEETLVLTNDAAFIVSTKNKTVITAMDRSALSGNVFTNIDGAVIV